MPNSTAYNLLEACREPGCPVCRLEQQAVERYLDHHFYENVNSPAWRDQLRASLGFCQEHAWLGVEERLGDALGFAIIYHDIVNNLLDQSKEADSPQQSSRRRTSLLKQGPEQRRTVTERMLSALTPGKRCPVCEHREEATHTLVSVLMEEMKTPEMREALKASEGLCVFHLRVALEHGKDRSAAEELIAIHREKFQSLRAELAEFIRKNDYRVIVEGFGKEGNAWLRAIALIAGNQKKT